MIHPALAPLGYLLAFAGLGLVIIAVSAPAFVLAYYLYAWAADRIAARRQIRARVRRLTRYRTRY